ncbi:serine/threonine-protein kinase [Polyangium aurulentum]|uniref:serine/threonine-protein kinase n=1 Tax=Polyangium aurulentum TaxID=2567896 RepID=UPI0010AE5ED0|nr:serine/threonine-protein kinase [Polyangium aurulentum]UQA57092.1 serine/threonine protein kinase [Polyangium aurulentum]
MRTGDLIAGRFEIERHTAQGGMAHIYRALDRESGEPVAVKLVLDPDNTNAERFHREASILESLDHPHVVRYVAHGFAEDGTAYLVTEWLEGSSLDHVLSRGPLEIEDAVRLAGCVADALSAMHAAGIVHRDLKPSNIFLPDGQVDEAKVLGFDIAWLEGSSPISASGAILGTPAYMAPEQILGHQVDGRADLFALGGVLFECLTGRIPFEETNLMAILGKVLSETAPRVSELRPEVHPMFDVLVADLLEKNPDERPKDGQVTRSLAVLRALYAVRSGRPSRRSAFKLRDALGPRSSDGPKSTPLEAFPETLSEPAYPPLCLSAWFPDQSGDQARITVGVPARLCVNLGPREERGGVRISVALTPEGAAALDLADHAHVLVLCPGARVSPLRQRIRLPPNPARVLSFMVTALRADDLEIEIVLLVQNEPIHRASFWVRAEPADMLRSEVTP